MIKKQIPLLLITLILFTSCGAFNKTITAPESVEFKTITEHNVFSSISIPMSGNDFKAKYEQPDQVLPTIRYSGSAPVSVWSSVNNYEGTLEEQFQNLKQAQGFILKDDSKVIYEELKIGKHEVARIDISRKFGDSGYSSLAYGYLIQYENKAALLFLKDGYITPDTDKDLYKSNLDEVFVYMIETMEFKN